MTLKSAPTQEADKSQGNSPLFLGCPTVVLPTNGSTSPNGRAPIRTFGFIRAVYLITPAEVAASGLLTGAVPGSIGWHYTTAPGAAQGGTLAIYLENTGDTTNNKSTTWATAISTMQLVSTGGVTLPNTTNFFDIPFSGGTPFTYTGGGLYVAFDWVNSGTPGGGAVVSCTNVLTAGLLSNQSNAAPPTVLGASNFRPETRLTPSVGSANDASVDIVYSVGSLPQSLVGPHVVQALITNKGTGTQTNLPVTLTVTGAQSFTDTQNIASLAGCTGTAIVTFAGMPITAIGSDTLTVSVPSDQNNANNSKANPFNATAATYNYKYPGTTLQGGVGNTGVIQLGSKLTVTSATQVDTVQLEFASSPATTYRVAIYNDNSGVPGTLLYEDAADRTPVAGPVSIRLPAPVAVGPGAFYIVAEQTGANNYSLSFDTESPLRVGSFFFTTTIPAGTWGDFAPANTFKLNMGAVLGACIAPPTVSVTPDTSSVCQGGTLHFTCNVSGANGATTFQWTENGTNILGATSSTLNVTKAGAGSFTYNCKVTDDAGCTNIIDATPSTGTWIANGGTCEDGNPCTGPDTCVSGTCTAGPNPCNDNDACTNDICDGQGGCSYTPVNCDDLSQCTADSCVPATGCQHVNLTGPCTDGNRCTVGDTCQAGVCVPGPTPAPVQLCNTDGISIRDQNSALPYPSSVVASGLDTILCNMTMDLINLDHSFPGDVDMLLTGPTRNTIPYSDIGDLRITSPVTLHLDDAAANPMPTTGALASGTYKPTNVGAGDSFPAPAPTPSGNVAFSTFNGIDPNGTWSLYVVDDSAGDTGTLGRWCINLIAVPCTTLADCDDGTLCTNDACNAGACSHTPVNCADGNACTDDTCNPGTGLCPHAPTNCDDVNACTTDSCNNVTGCQHTPVPLPIVTNLKFAANKHAITWDPVAGGAPYDIIYGDVQVLHSSGVTASVGGCLGDNGGSPASDDSDSPSAGQGFWYLARSRGCGGVTGTYNEGGAQQANRDPLIPAPPVDCSRP